MGDIIKSDDFGLEIVPKLKQEQNQLSQSEKTPIYFMCDKQEFEVVLYNFSNVDCDCVLEMSGQLCSAKPLSMGTFRIHKGTKVAIGRPVKRKRKFIFITETDERIANGLIKENDCRNGVIIANFYLGEEVEKAKGFAFIVRCSEPILKTRGLKRTGGDIAFGGLSEEVFKRVPKLQCISGIKETRIIVKLSPTMKEDIGIEPMTKRLGTKKKK